MHGRFKIMNYEEKYKKSLEKARELMDKGYDVLMPEIFPELKESEDEKIRNFLIDFIKICTWTEKEDQGWPLREDCLAWLEKQGQKEATWNKEDEENINNILYVFNQLRGISFYKEDDTVEKIINWLKSLKDRLCSNNEYDKDMLGAIEYCKKNNRPFEKEHLAWLEKQDKENNTYIINNTPNCGISVYVNEELKESEDERIKEQLSEFLHDNMLYQDAQYFDSWLEKLIENQKD